MTAPALGLDVRPEPLDNEVQTRGRHPFLRLVVLRVAYGILLAFLVSVLVFVATQALPGDTARAILGRDASPERVAALRQELGLDRSLVAQYGSWLGGLLTGDLGDSLAARRPISEYLGPRLRNSAVLVLACAVIAIPLALVLGVWGAVKRGRPAERAASAVTLSLASLPEFVVGVGLILLLATGVFHVLPAVSLLDAGETPLSQPDVLVLPTLTLVVLVVPYVSRMVRAAVAEALDSEYVEAARLNGVPERRVLWRDALPNALAPIAQVVAIVLAFLAGGTVIVETLFNYPGVGLSLTEAVSLRDLPVIQILAVGIAVLYIALNLIADMVSLAVTPRARTGMQRS